MSWRVDSFSGSWKVNYFSCFLQFDRMYQHWVPLGRARPRFIEALILLCYVDDLRPQVLEMFEMVEAKTKEITNKLRTMDSENTKLSSENEVLCSEIESLVMVEVDLEAKLRSTDEGRRQAEHKALEAQSLKKIAENAQRRAEEKVIVFEEMALAKHKQLVEAMADLARAKEQLARLEPSTCADTKEAAGSTCQAFYPVS
ncbi:hypothetical protein Fot_28656 [Forsythia ovata]|uniref:Uncharacterized protein n=1 Tax=Forsythia ovata TaxID=205694 RepID=A0ABD1TQH9_9LAMI